MGTGPVFIVDVIDLSKLPKTPRDAYLEAAAERIREHRRPLPGKPTGTAIVDLEIDDGGGALDQRIQKTSGKKQLDDGALALIDRSVPFPKPFPEALEGGTLKLRVPVNFTRNRP